MSSYTNLLTHGRTTTVQSLVNVTIPPTESCRELRLASGEKGLVSDCTQEQAANPLLLLLREILGTASRPAGYEERRSLLKEPSSDQTPLKQRINSYSTVCTAINSVQ